MASILRLRNLIGTTATLLVAATLPAATYYVDVNDPDAVNTPSCGTISKPCFAMQAAINRADSGDTILVAEGTYTYDGSLDPITCAVTTAIACVANKELTFLGGYASGDWSTRDPDSYPTVLDGENTRRGFLIRRGQLTSDPASATVDGFVVERGLADSSPAEGDDAFGGAFSAVLVDNIVIRNSVFRDSRAIGAAAATAGGAGRGGGVSIRGHDELTTTVVIDRVTVEDNVAMGGEGDIRGGRAVGGGVFLKDIDKLTATNFTVQRNSALGGPSDGAGEFGGNRADVLGGGIGMLTNDDAVFRELTVVDNLADGGDPTGLGGTGGNSFGGGFYGERSFFEIEGAEIRENLAQGGTALNGSIANPAKGSIGAGGGLTTFLAELTMSRANIVGNTARGGDGPANPDHGDRGTVGGGGCYFEELSPDGYGYVSVENSVIASNAAELGSGDGGGGGGGGIFVLGIEVDMDHIVIADNTLSEFILGGQGIVVNTRRRGFPDQLTSHATLTFSTISDHLFAGESGVRVNELSSIDFGGHATLFANNSIDWDGAGAIIGTGAILNDTSVDFVSPGPPDYDYHLLLSSPAIDAAVGSSVADDLDGALRGSARDLGADEACFAAVEDLLLSGAVISGNADEEACRTLTVQDTTITGSGIATFRAPVSVILRDGFNVESGGRLTIENVTP